ncbi:MAG: hypothetical protein QXU33_00025 [Candidatus Methanomethyliaceae archaeon]|nr:hypothetical protein [Candidatus Verstraetearchaeota archaeon]
MIEWYGTPDELNIPKHDMELIEKWVEDNKKELHEIYHFLHAHEMEGSKIIYGEQIEETKGDTRIISYEVYIIYDAAFIIRSEERQISGTNEIVKSSTRLGSLELPKVEGCKDCSPSK